MICFICIFNIQLLFSTWNLNLSCEKELFTKNWKSRKCCEIDIHFTKKESVRQVLARKVRKSIWMHFANCIVFASIPGSVDFFNMKPDHVVHLSGKVLQHLHHFPWHTLKSFHVTLANVTCCKLMPMFSLFHLNILLATRLLVVWLRLKLSMFELESIRCQLKCAYWMVNT